jgi:predicted SprT family Zn-dependent metalloprotease
MKKLKKYIPLLIEKEDYNLQKKYKEFNKKVFNNELPDKIPLVYVNKDATWVGQAYNKGNIPEKIEINKKHFEDYTTRKKDSLLIHEMLHLWIAVRGYIAKGNLHQGEFLKKAKEIEKKSNFTISGKFVKSIEDDFADLKKGDTYLLFFLSDDKLMWKNFRSLEIFSSKEKALEYVQKLKDKGDSDYKTYKHLYNVVTNSPIIDEEPAKAHEDKLKGYFFSTPEIKYIINNIKKFPNSVISKGSIGWDPSKKELSVFKIR